MLRVCWPIDSDPSVLNVETSGSKEGKLELRRRMVEALIPSTFSQDRCSLFPQGIRLDCMSAT
jgi:hypothetical protein